MEEALLKTIVCELPQENLETVCRDKLSLLPEWRRKEAEAYCSWSDKLQNAESYLLLCRLMEEHTGVRQMPCFAYGEYGKPFLPGCLGLHFNLSHCSRAVMCVLADQEVGCDIEEVPDRPDADVLRVAFSEEEQRRILQSDRQAVEFAKLWTRKEALLKQQGTGLTDDLPGLMSSPIARRAAFSTIVCEDRGYVYTTCTLRL